jgi:hypothetical protein
MLVAAASVAKRRSRLECAACGLTLATQPRDGARCSREGGTMRFGIHLANWGPWASPAVMAELALGAERLGLH